MHATRTDPEALGDEIAGGDGDGGPTTAWPGAAARAATRRAVLRAVASGFVAVAAGSTAGAGAKERGHHARTGGAAAAASDAGASGEAAASRSAAEPSASADRSDDPRRTRIAGSVLDGSGFLVGNIQVDIYAVDGGSTRYLRSVTTDWLGRFDTRLPAGRRYGFQVWDPIVPRLGPYVGPVRVEGRRQRLTLYYI